MPQGIVISHRDLMLATAAKDPFDDANWIYEPKMDGFRSLAIKEVDRVRMLTRRGNDLAPCFPEIKECLRLLPDIVLDGELVVLDATGKSDFERLRRRALLKKPISVEYAAKADPAALFVFDVLGVGAKDVRSLPLLKRKDIVQDVLRGSERLRAVQYVGEQGQRLYEAASALQLEGIVAKRADSTYRAGRSRDWVKIRTPHGRHVQDRRSEEWVGNAIRKQLHAGSAYFVPTATERERFRVPLV